MRHSKILETHAFNATAWTDFFWVSEDAEDYHTLQHLVERIFQLPSDSDHLQPCGLDVAEILRHLEVDQTTIMAALLCDPRFNKLLSVEQIQQQYGQAPGALVDNMRNLQRFRDCIETTDTSIAPKEQAEQLRRMLLAMVSDVRAVLIKLAWNLQYLRLIAKHEISETHRCIARMTMDLYAPLANRLGISQIKWELEDLSFRLLHPLQYKAIASSLAGKRIEREQFINDVVRQIKELLAQKQLKAEVYGRPKHIYSIWKKQSRKQVDIDGLYDLRAVRIIVDDTHTCYKILDVVHEQWMHIPEEYDDYIANKKPNGYQSIHTVVLVGAQKKYVEIQIRTRDMHQFAELGVAAHWRYKEGGKQDQALDKAINSLRRLLDANETDSELLEDFRTEVFTDRVFVVTPKGKIIDLPKGATPVDFAYYVHTSVGHRCIGAKVSGHLVPLDYTLRNGEQVEIIVGQEEHPRQDWLNAELGYVKSAGVRQKIRQWFSQQHHEQNYKDGEKLLEKERHLLNLPKFNYVELAKQFNRSSEREFVIAVGKSDISVAQLRNFLLRKHEPELKLRKSKVAEQNINDIEVRGVKHLYTRMASCCHPVNGDDIIGYLSQGRGVIVHRTDCPDLSYLRKERADRLIEVAWSSNAAAYAADITISTYHKAGVLSQIANLLAREQINIVNLNTRSTQDSCFAVMDLTLEVRDLDQLVGVLEKLLKLPAVIDAQRRI